MSITIPIDSLSSTGEGIGSSDGLKVFVEGALPGEIVHVEWLRHKKNYAEAKLKEVVRVSPQRVDPACPLFGACGGCQVMHLDYSAQLAYKEMRVKEALERIGHLDNLPPIRPCLPAPSPLGYRSKIQLPIAWINGTKQIGFYRKNTHEIIPLKRCLIQAPQGEAILDFLFTHLDLHSVHHLMLRHAFFEEEILVTFVADKRVDQELLPLAQELMELYPAVKGIMLNLQSKTTNTVLGPTFSCLAGRPFIYERLLNRRFKISPAAFFQVNPAQTQCMYAKTLALAELEPQEQLLDAYCGVGALAIFAADRVTSVFGIECVKQAIVDARSNAELNGLSNCTFLLGKAEEKIRSLPPFDTVFLNPPRKGCDPSLLQALLATRPRKVVYLSCNPATLARDLSLLTSYRLEAIQPFDLFPQTMHVETAVRLSLK